MHRLSPGQASDSVGDDGEAVLDEFAPGTRFGRYEIRKLLGRGAFGAVYEALQIEPLQRSLALKVLHEIARTNQQLVGRFVREAQIAASITHPHICTIFDIGSEGSVPFIAMERLQGEALDARLDREPVLSPAVTVDTLLPILSAVAAVHDAGIVHRDLKPANIFLSTPRPGAMVPKLLDFGIVKVLDRNANVVRTETRTFLGTPHYTSPEQAMDASAIDVHSDQWSIGVILYECLTGARPWREGPVLQVLFEITASEIAPPSTKRPSIPPQLDAIVMRTLQRDPTHRFGSVRALAGALLPFATATVREAWREEFDSHAPTPVRATAPPVRVVGRAQTLASAQVAPPPRPEPRFEPEHPAPPRQPAAATQIGVPRAPRFSALQAAPPPLAPARRWLWPALAAAVALLATVAFLALRASPAPRADAAPVVPLAEPEPPEPRELPAPPVVPVQPAEASPVIALPPAPVVPAASRPDAVEAPRSVHPRRRVQHPSGVPVPTTPAAGAIPNV